MLPIRGINSGVTRALKHLRDQGLDISPWIEAFAFDLGATRDVFTAHVLGLAKKFLPCWRLESVLIHLPLSGCMMGYGLDVMSMTRLYMLLKIMSDVSCFLTLTRTPVCFRSLICMRRGRLPSPLAHPRLTPRCLLDAIKGPNEGGEGGRLLGNFLLPNSVIDKLLSARSLAILTGLASVPA